MEAKGKIKGHGQCAHVHVMTIYSGVSSTVVSIFNFGTTWNGQVHAPAALPAEKNSLAHVEDEAESALQSVSTISREKPLEPNRNRTTVLRLCRPKSTGHTNCATIGSFLPKATEMIPSEHSNVAILNVFKTLLLPL